ncbi:hypothetical protein [Glutamicibacter ardleyensis]|uniref:Prealbumin-like fold domain-containing protein n=1 Tax=Glutamicibacter ardleyensis TaxID=225894 RepID=A0ABQ2DGB0_9MICC|nr:hypothetical protein [Glutamicibacter ardleyensis]GGJ55613.1 hypothetical protein GCM10007173_12980 [Glutamicibacter ardleyensis]
MSTYLKESIEFQQILVTVDGQPRTDFQVSLVSYGQRPGEWAANVEVDGKHGVMIENLEPGEYWIYTKVEDNPETPVLLAGRVYIR